jgi:hypothetical protein
MYSQLLNQVNKLRPIRGLFPLLIGLLMSVSGCDSEETQKDTLPPLPDLGRLCATDCVDYSVVDMEVDVDAGLPQCNDEIDNDGDGQIDGFDDGCTSPDDDDERSPDQIPACSDGEDNDGDGLTDYPADPECESALFEFEERPPLAIPQCRDGEDNDGDDKIDYPLDLGCGHPDDLDESDDPPTIPQCRDERDNDYDGLIDLSDPGCSEPDDPLELNGRTEDPPWCSDGIDNDGDGLIDFPRDPGCESAGDNDELTPPFAPICFDDLDNDEDGLIDFPYDPGCAGVGDQDETDPFELPQCSDGVDNDLDSKIDFPDDPGCLSRGDQQEVGACGDTFESQVIESGVIVRGQLAQGSFNSRGSCGGQGGREIVFRYVVRKEIQALVISTEFPENEVETTIYIRRRCSAQESEILCNQETIDGYPAQNLRLEKPELGEYFIFLDGASNDLGAYALQIKEEAIPECKNGVDDDFNGQIDFPYDAGCNDPYDATERLPLSVPACADDIDNDGDSLTDFPNDLGCLYSGDESEEDICGQGTPVSFFPTGDLEVYGDTSNSPSREEGSCAQGNYPEIIYLFENPFSANVRVSVDHPETLQPTALHVRKNTCQREGQEGEWTNEIACAIGSGDDPKATLNLLSLAPGPYYIFVDHFGNLGGPFKLTIEFERLGPSCQNYKDDDGDGFIDGEDYGCSSPNDDLEDDDPDRTNPNYQPPACSDGVDNDDDGYIDYPYDPGCETRGDSDETTPDRLPACFNELDDDQDDLFDLDDPGCSSASDPIELDISPKPQCQNRLDDDLDGYIDYPYDPHCLHKGDLSEMNDDQVQECGDEIDNDEDGLIDYPHDPGCFSAGSLSEIDPDILPICFNGIDDDEDGLIDYPEEPGCDFAADQDETDPSLLPQCSNGIDDDRDRRTDWPDDPECLSAADRSERTR